MSRRDVPVDVAASLLSAGNPVWSTALDAETPWTPNIGIFRWQTRWSVFQGRRKGGIATSSVIASSLFHKLN
jgi:hypothetical protein